ncbi:MAG: hydroxyphenylacetyl-CoA thioesterase PaaI [Gemmatimonadota bacterium]
MTGDVAQTRAGRIAHAMMSRDLFSQWLGIEISDIGDGYCSCRMTVRPDMLNGLGVAHGGIAFSLADSAFAFACNSRGDVTVSIENSVTYPAPVNPGDVLTAVAREEAASNRLGYYAVEVRNQRDETVALFRGTAYRTPRRHSAADD